jgi:tellurite resistance protein
MISPHAALIYAMVLAAVADRDLTKAETGAIDGIVSHLPVFRGYDAEHTGMTANACIGLLDDEDGLDKAIDLIKGALSPRLRETAYALACDVAAADGEVAQEVLRLLEMLRHHLDIDRLTAAAIERGARARFTRIE